MPWIPDPRRRWRLAARAALAAPVVLAIVGSIWAWRDLPPVTVPSISTAVMASAPALPPLDPQAFQIALWRPLSDQPTASAAAPTVQVTLFAVMRRQGILTAAIDFGPGEGLRYLTAGQIHGAITVVMVDAGGANITVNGVPQRLVVK